MELGFQELKELNFWKAVLAELLVTVFYIVIVCGSGLSEANPSHLHLSLTLAFTVAVLASAFWDVSGGHFNPAVSIAVLLSKKISVIRFIFYVIAQCIGSVAGAGLLYFFTPKSFRGTLGGLSIHHEIKPGVAFLIEVTLTFPFIWTVVSCADRKLTGFQAPFAIGLSVGIGLLMGIPYTGGALNPIRAFGPAMVMNQRENHWVYWAGPMLGAILATLCYHHVFKIKAKKTDLPTVIINEQNNNFTHVTIRECAT